MTIQELHDKLFDVLCFVDDVCQKENIRYFLDSGTLLGAAREQNFIPWDDDADIKVLAEDYPRLRKALEKHMPSYMKIIEPEDFSPAFYDFVFRVVDTRYMLNPETEETAYYYNLENYVGADIFLFTRTPGSTLARHWLLLSSKVLYGLGMAHRHHLDLKKYSKMQKAQILLLSFIGRAIPAHRVCKWWRNNILRYSNQPSASRFCSNYSLKSLQFFPEENYATSAELPIRDHMFKVPAGYDQELRQQYGDYMTPVRDTSRYVQHLHS